MTRWEKIAARFRELEPDFRAGRLSLIEVLDIADENLHGCVVCPGCGRHALHGTQDTCRVCAIERMKFATDEKLLEIEAHRAAVTSRQQLRRLRIELGDDCPEHLRARGHSSREPRTCPGCGDVFEVTRHAPPETTCKTCRRRAAREAADLDQHHDQGGTE